MFFSVAPSSRCDIRGFIPLYNPKFILFEIFWGIYVKFGYLENKCQENYFISFTFFIVFKNDLIRTQ